MFNSPSSTSAPSAPTPNLAPPTQSSTFNAHCPNPPINVMRSASYLSIMNVLDLAAPVKCPATSIAALVDGTGISALNGTGISALVSLLCFYCSPSRAVAGLAATELVSVGLPHIAVDGHLPRRRSLTPVLGCGNSSGRLASKCGKIPPRILGRLAFYLDVLRSLAVRTRGPLGLLFASSPVLVDSPVLDARPVDGAAQDA